MQITIEDLNKITYPLIQKILKLEEENKTLKDFIKEMANTYLANDRKVESINSHPFLEQFRD